MLFVLFQSTDVLRAKGVNGGLCMRSKFEFYASSDNVDVKYDNLLSSKQLFFPSANLPLWSRHRIK